MMKKIIGIIPKGVLFDMEQGNDSDIYHLGNNYSARIKEAGAIPVCIAPVDGRVSEEMLDLCDGFIAQGGKQMWPYHFQVIHHAVEHGKKYLGICLGMQLIHRYFALRKLVEDQKMDGDIVENIINLFCVQNIGSDLLKPVEGHRAAFVPRDNADIAKHNVDVVPGTLLHRLIGKESIRAVSLHSWQVADPVDDLTVNAWASNGSGIIEGVEYSNNILGVQFHPEMDTLLPEIFRFLTED